MDGSGDPGDPSADPPERSGADGGAGDPAGSSIPNLSRRRFGSGVVAIVLATPLSGGLSGDPSDRGSRRNDATRFQGSAQVETDGWQVSGVRVEEQFRFVGASVVLFNPTDHPRSVKVRYLLYREDGRQEYRAEEWVTVPGGEERHAARWWKKDRPGTTSPRIGFADVEIVESVDGVVDEDPTDGTTTTSMAPTSTSTVPTTTATTESTTTSATTVPETSTSAARPTTTSVPTETTGATTTTTPGFGLLATLAALFTAGIAWIAARRR